MVYKNFIWDWNGTIINDIDLSVSILNKFLTQRGLKNVSLLEYREIFDFPVKDYYQAVGFNFDKEDFSVIGQQYIETYNSRICETTIFSDVVETLDFINKNGGKNYIVSARKNSELVKDLEIFNLKKYFVEVCGITDNLGGGKEFLAEEFKKRHSLSAQDTVFVGDTTHDFKISQIIGCSCVLVCRGHQSRKRLESKTKNVIDNFSQFLDAIKN